MASRPSSTAVGSLNQPFKAGSVAVESPDIASLTLVTPLPFVARIYIGPWLVFYPLAAYAFYVEYDRYIKSIGTLARANEVGQGLQLTFDGVTCRVVLPPLYRALRRARAEFLGNEVEHWVQESWRGQACESLRCGHASSGFGDARFLRERQELTERDSCRLLGLIPPGSSRLSPKLTAVALRSSSSSEQRCAFPSRLRACSA